MKDINEIISGNIRTLLRFQGKKQTDLANALNTNKQTVNKMLNGSRLINAVELKSISEYLGVKMEDLVKDSNPEIETNMVRAFMGKVESEQAKRTLTIADELSDMILFHSRVRENGDAMMMPWTDEI